MINIFQPSVGDDSLRELEGVFRSNWLGRGDQVTRFEAELSNFLGVKRANLHTVACATDGIFGIFKILELSPSKNEVIIPSISFPAVGSAVLEAGLVPVIVDVELGTGNISLASVEKSFTPNTGAVFITHYGGIPVDVSGLRSIVGNDVYILEDAACAFGTFVNGRACGTEADFGCWSFDAMKMLVAGEGGGCYFGSEELATKAREYFYLGLPSSEKSGLDKASDSRRWWEYQLTMPGRRSMFTNVNAAIALPQFANLKRNFDRRETIRSEYCKVIDATSNLQYSRQEKVNVVYSNYFFTVISENRDALAAYLKENNVYTTFRYFPLHELDLFEPFISSDLVGAKEFSETALNIPIHHNLTDTDVCTICQLLKAWSG